MQILNEAFASVVPLSGLLGFCLGTFASLFAWMVRQPYRLFRHITGAGVGR